MAIPIYLLVHLMRLFSADTAIFSKNDSKKFPAKALEKLPSKVAHNPTRPTVFNPANFRFVQLRQFYSMKFSHL